MTDNVMAGSEPVTTDDDLALEPSLEEIIPPPAQDSREDRTRADRNHAR